MGTSENNGSVQQVPALPQLQAALAATGAQLQAAQMQAAVPTSALAAAMAPLQQMLMALQQPPPSAEALQLQAALAGQSVQMQAQSVQLQALQSAFSGRLAAEAAADERRAGVRLLVGAVVVVGIGVGGTLLYQRYRAANP